MRTGELEVNEHSGEVKLSVRVDTGDTDGLNAQLRKEAGKGFTLGGTMRMVAEIPFDFVQSLALSGDRDGVVLFDATSDPQEKRRALRGVLYRFPEFRISDGNI